MPSKRVALPRLVWVVFMLTTLTAPAQAGIVLLVTFQGLPAPGLNSLLFTAVGTGGDTVGAFANLNLTGAHQVWPNAAFNADSPVAGDLQTGFGNAAWEPFDSHLLIDPALNITSPGFGLAETNDGSDPAGLSPLVPADLLFAAFPGDAGLGSLFLRASRRDWC